MSEIFVDNQKWQMEELESAMMDALSNDRVEFVSLLLENGVSIGHFLTMKRLLDLYRERSKMSVAFQQIIGEYKLRKGFFLSDINDIINRMLGGRRQNESDGISVTTGLKESGLGLLKTPQYRTQIEHFTNPYNELFLWAVLCNMQKMALFMWERGDNNLARALIGAKIYMEIAEDLEGDELRNDVYERVTSHAQEFKDVALALLDECYRANELAAQKLLTYYLKDWCGHSCLSLAVTLKHEEFVAHVSCQSLLSEIWMGAMKNLYMPSFMVILGIIAPPTICCIEFKTKRQLSLLPVTVVEHQHDIEQADGNFGCSSDEGEEQDSLTRRESERSRHKVSSRERKKRKYTIAPRSDGSMSHQYSERRLSFGRKFLEFYRAPITKFWANVIAYMMFLMLFSYVILVNERGSSLVAEIALIVFVCSLCTEELRQIIQSDASGTESRFVAWASSKWNICDGIAVLLFFLGMGLRFHSPTAHIGHVIYSLDIMLWIIRLLDIFSVSKHLGPYVVMIGRMTIDMLYFLVIMVVFLLAYGVAQQAILFPKQEATWNIISMILFRPYFQTYGELFITDPLQLDNTTTEFSTPRYNDYGGVISTLILAFYLLVANILLLNLLIAIFNNTFSEVQANSNQIWKFQRYGLIMEYAQRPVLVPPLIILNHVIELVICCWNKICCCGKNADKNDFPSDNRLKLFLEKRELEELLMFEEHCLFSYLYNRDTLFNATAEERVKVIGNRIESITTHLEEMAKESFSRDTAQTKTITAMHGRVRQLERNTKAIIHMLSTRYGMSPTRYGMEFESEDEEPDDHGHGMRKEKLSSELISHFRAVAGSPLLRQAGKQVAHAVKAFKGGDDDSPSPPCSKRRRGSGESPATSPVVEEEEVPKTFKDLAPRHSKRSRDDLEGMPSVHVKARRTPYPMSSIERYPLLDKQVEWKAMVLGYDPPSHTADAILHSSADPDLQSTAAPDVKLSFNAVDGNINRQSYTGHYDIIQGLPRNPMGRTGLTGRGLLEHWGPNHTHCHIITRWRRLTIDGNIERRDKHPVLEFITVKSHDSQKWELPENKLTVDKTSTKALVNDLCENILVAMEVSSDVEKHVKKAQLDKLFQESGMEVFHGYVDDERNTDNAWIETMVTNYHDETGEILGSLQFMMKESKQDLAWLVANCQLNLPENQVLFLRRVAKLHKAFF